MVLASLTDVQGYQMSYTYYTSTCDDHYQLSMSLGQPVRHHAGRAEWCFRNKWMGVDITNLVKIHFLSRQTCLNHQLSFGSVSTPTCIYNNIQHSPQHTWKSHPPCFFWNRSVILCTCTSLYTQCHAFVNRIIGGAQVTVMLHNGVQHLLTPEGNTTGVNQFTHVSTDLLYTVHVHYCIRIVS